MRIVTDSAADLPDNELKDFGITVVPLFINFPEGQIGADQISADEFYTRLKNMQPKLPSTSQPSSGQFAAVYNKLHDLGEEILSIHISSGLSGTIEAARLGAQEIKDNMIEVVDSLTLSGGERFQVIAAALANRAGWGRKEIIDHMAKLRAQTEVIYTLETLDYLARGGRIGRVQALAGSLLKIKPVICVDKADGKYNSVGRGRTLRQTMDKIAEYLVEKFGKQQELWVSVLHGQLADQAQILAEILKQQLHVGKLEILRISPVLGVHTGPGIVGAAVVPLNLMDKFE